MVATVLNYSNQSNSTLIAQQVSVAGAQLSLAPTQLCPKQRVWALGAELS